MADITPAQREQLAKFDASKPLFINTSEIEGLEDYVGRFVFRRPTNGDRIKIAINLAKLKGGVEIDLFHDNLAYILATFDVVCMEKPKNLEFDMLPDAQPVFALYERFNEWVELFRIRIQAAKEATGKGESK